MKTVWVFTKGNMFAYENSRLIENLESYGINTRLIDPEECSLVNFQVLINAESVKYPDLVLVRFGAGITKTMLAIIEQFELLGIPCINTARSISLAANKLITGQKLAAANIPIPKTMMLSANNLSLVETHMGYPAVIKVLVGSYGAGVHLVNTHDDLLKLMEFITVLGIDKPFIAQEFIKTNPGQDLRVLVVGNKVIGAMRRIAGSGEFRANISQGGHGEPYPITPEIEHLALSTARILGLTIAGIDLLFTDTGFCVCEANSNPGFKGFEQYCDIDVAAIIANYANEYLSDLG